MIEIGVDQGILDLEAKLGLPGGFFKQLLDEDDWSFIIKVHALFEAACAHLLVFHFGEESLSNLFARLDLSNKTTGKLAFLKAVELLGEEERRYISSLSELRNALVHDVRNSAFNLQEFVRGFSDNELTNFAKRFSPYEIKLQRLAQKPLPGNSINAPSLADLIKRAKTAPKLHVWLGAYNTLVAISEMYGYSDYKQYVKARQIFDRDDEEI